MEDTRLGPYQILAELGSGGMGKVFKAEVVGPVSGPASGPASGLEPGCTVALKVIHAHLLENPGFFKRFLREADIGRTIEHANVVRTFDCDALLHDGTQQNFLVMEYVEGQTLRDLLKELERVPEELCRHIGREVAKGLSAIHDAGAVHRDLKPENVLITSAHEVKIMDLGVARLQDEAIRLSQTGQFLGSILYAAPEAFRGGVVGIDGRADLYSLGLLLYELATGVHPFRHDDIKVVLDRQLNDVPRRAGDVNPQLSPFFEELLQTLLHKAPDDRIESAEALVQVLADGESGTWWHGREQRARDGSKRALRRIRIPRETAVHGRERELAALQTAYERAREGEGQAVLVEGEAGIGKTRLVDEFVARLEASGEDVGFLFGAYPPGGAATAAGAFSTAYREQFGANSLERTLHDYLATTPTLIPAFAALLLGEPVPAGAMALNQEALHTVFLKVTRALARERPLVILIEDLHLAPAEGRALFSALAYGLADARVLLVGTARRELDEAWVSGFQGVPNAQRLAVERLRPKELTALLLDALGSRAVAEQLGFLIAEKSDGNPFFAFAILDSLREDGLLECRAGGDWATTAVIRDVQIPPAVQELIAARVASLDDADRELLELASCCGFSFDPDLVAEAAGEGVLAGLRRFGRIEKHHRLIRSLGRECEFDHHQIQEALYQGLMPQLRERCHLALADLIESRLQGVGPIPTTGAAAVDLCEHFLASSAPVRARPYVDGALRHLRAGYLNDAAIELADAALGVEGLFEGDERASLLLAKASACDVLGRSEETRAALEEALRLADAGEDPTLRARVRHDWGRYWISRGRADRGLDVYAAALDLASTSGDRLLEAKCAGGVGTACARLGRFEEARLHHRRQLDIATQLGAERVRASATGSLGSVAFYEGRYAEARDFYAKDVAICRETGDRHAEAAALENLAVACRLVGRLDEATAYREQSLARFRSIGDRRGEGIALSNLGILLLDRGRLTEALASYEEALELCRSVGDRQTEANTESSVGSLYLELGALHEAQTHFQRALDLTREVGDKRGESTAAEALTFVAYRRGDAESACERMQELVREWREAGLDLRVGEGLFALGAIQLGLGRREEAIASLEESRVLGAKVGRARLVVLTTVALAAAGAIPASDAVDVYGQHASSLSLSSRMQALNDLWAATGEETYLREAHKALRALQQSAPEAYRDSMIQEVALYREIDAAYRRLPPSR